MSTQVEMDLTSDDVEAAFDDGRLYIIVDEPRTVGNCSFARSKTVTWDEKVRLVHVISKPAGGEIMGYVQIFGELRQRGPNYHGEWPEMHAAVSRRLGMPVITIASAEAA